MQKLGQAIGASSSSAETVTAPVEKAETEETEFDNESIIHQAASVGDIEVYMICFNYQALLSLVCLFYCEVCLVYDIALDFSMVIII